jgi:hypothetical protein
MTRKAKEKEAQAGSNGFNPEVMNSFVDELQAFVDKLESEHGIYMKKCRGIREDMDTVYERAKNAGLPVRPLKAVMKKLGLESKIEALKTKMEDDVRETYEAMNRALGQLVGTPLGDAVAERHPASPTSLDRLDS